MYSKDTVYQAHLTSKKHLKAAANPPADAPQTNGTTQHSKTSRDSKEYRLASLEDQIGSLLSDMSSPLLPVRAETKSNTERKAALTDRERALEIDELEKREAEEAARNARDALGAGKRDQYALKTDEDEENERIYNPLKLPLGWDGKPIPYVRPLACTDVVD
jgi:splicing factor 3A subunit 3